MGDELDETILREIVARGPDGLLVVDEADVVLWANAAAAALAGASAAALRGTVLAGILPGDRADVRRGGLRALSRRDGGLVHVAVAHAALGSQGLGMFSLRTLGDGERVLVRDHERLERALASLEATETLLVRGMLSAGVLHELATPLNAVGFAIDALRSDDAATRAEALECARAGVEHMRRLFDDFRAVATSASGPAAAADLREVVETALRLAAPTILGADADVSVRIDTEGLVAAERVRLVQIVTNLLVNAAHAVSEVSGRRCVHVETSHDGPWIAIDVVDSGTGIAAEDLAHVFEPFFTTKPVGSGTGLGLSICRTLVRAIGGEIALTSEVGTGTRVRVRVPLAPSRGDDHDPSDRAASAR